MKQKWKNPVLFKMGVENTNEGENGFGINPGYNGKVKCNICNQIFTGGDAYENHKELDESAFGTECPVAKKGDGILQAEYSLIS